MVNQIASIAHYEKILNKVSDFINIPEKHCIA